MLYEVWSAKPGKPFRFTGIIESNFRWAKYYWLGGRSILNDRRYSLRRRAS